MVARALDGRRLGVHHVALLKDGAHASLDIRAHDAQELAESLGPLARELVSPVGVTRVLLLVARDGAELFD